MRIHSAHHGFSNVAKKLRLFLRDILQTNVLFRFLLRSSVNPASDKQPAYSHVRQCYILFREILKHVQLAESLTSQKEHIATKDYICLSHPQM